MWDPIKEFELIQEANQNIFQKIGSKLGIGGKKNDNSSEYFKSLSKDAQNALRKYQNKRQEKLGNPEKDPEKRYQQLLQKYLTKKITPEEQNEFLNLYNKKKSNCETPNKLFQSIPGSHAAKFGKNGNVKDLSGFKLSPKELSCYDLRQDPMKIAWLFYGNYDAERIYSKGNKIVFKGVWKSGNFGNNGFMEKGSVVSPKGTYPNEQKVRWFDTPPEGWEEVRTARVSQRPTEKEKQLAKEKLRAKYKGTNVSEYVPHVKKIKFKIPGIRVEELGIEVLDRKEEENVNRILKDMNSGAFLMTLQRLSKQIKKGVVDGYGEYPELAENFFAKKGSNILKIPEEQKKYLKYLNYVNHYIIDNIKDNTGKGHYEKTLTDDIKNILGFKPAPKTDAKADKKQNRSTFSDTPKLGAKKNKNKFQEGFTLSVKSVLLKQLNS